MFVRAKIKNGRGEEEARGTLAVPARRRHSIALRLTLALAMTAAGCAADPSELGSRSTASAASSGTTTDETLLPAARVSFHYSDSYTLSDPNSYSCAGDIHTYYSVYSLQTTSGQKKGLGDASPFTSTDSGSARTYRPAFIKNISVDLTDANAPVQGNSAYGCSMGNADSLPPVSNCATYDYGAVGGIPTTMGGTLLLLGGIAGSNYNSWSASCGPNVNPSTIVSSVGLNSCDSSFYALGIETLPPSLATDPANSLVPGLTYATSAISSWSKLSAVSGYEGPNAGAGASLAYDSALSNLLLFGGHVSVSSGSTYSADSNSTWSYDLLKQKWTALDTPAQFANDLLYMTDSSSGTSLDLLKAVGARALFGYAAVPNMGVRSLSSDGITGTSAIDSTDRVVVLGGIGSSGALKDAHRFNPTFGPEYTDTIKRSGSVMATGSLVQWLDSYHTVFLSNANTGSLFAPDLPSVTSGVADGTSNFVIGFGMTSGYHAGTSQGTIIAIGGFDADSATTSVTLGSGGGLQYSIPYSGTLTSGSAANFLGVPNDLGTNLVAPIAWQTVAEGGETDEKIPWYGGVSLLQGFNKSKNDVVYFGGSSCRDYLTDTSLSNCSFTNTGRYFRLGASFTTSLDDSTAGFETSYALNGSYPQRAGMAAARGEDGTGNVILVAWGGMSAPGVAADNSIYYLYNAGTSTTPNPTWVTATPTSTAMPSPAGNAALVYSHATRKFYLFGGYQTAGSAYTRSDTWELSVSGTCTGSSTCSFAWREMSDSGGLVCSPSCPSARRSHRIVEVNLNNTSPTAEPDCSSANVPCSFAIFMEGGTPDGISYIADRWILDPTANGGLGAWSRTDGIPPRRQAGMASVDYFAPTSGSTVHRAILFGGETANSASGAVAANGSGKAQYVLSAALGDTWMYDYNSNVWNRVKLLGHGYMDGYGGGTTSVDEQTESRQSFTANGPSPSTISELTPPPIAGAMMVARTYPGPTLTPSAAVTPLPIPEIYLFGGRAKDGSYMAFNQMYKFCAGSTGEKPSSVTPDNASCDAYDSTANPLSGSPSDGYVGRWIRKSPPDLSSAGGVNSATIKAYLGAATYDPLHDRIVFIGGFSSPYKITETSHTADNTIYEYTPPTSSSASATSKNYDGFWRRIDRCSGSSTPTARYGHTLSMDALNRQLVMVGGYSSTGTTLTQTLTPSSGSTYSIPEVWAAKRDDLLECYTWRQITVFGNSVDISTQVPPESGLAHSANVFIPSTGYNSGFYTMFDDACAQAGPIASSDTEVNKLNAGGVYIDIDRNELGPNENLLLNLTFLPMSTSQQKPDGQSFASNETASIKVHLIKSGTNTDSVQAASQPRHIKYSSTKEFPIVAQTLSILAPPLTGIRQEQVFVPLTLDPAIDRIRIERYSGSAILIDASVYRLGNR